MVDAGDAAAGVLGKRGVAGLGQPAGDLAGRGDADEDRLVVL
jgi:hypothetical protein